MTDAPRTSARRRAGIRVRITAVAASVVALALLVGAIGFWFTLRTALYGQLDAAAQQDAAAFAEQVDTAGPESLPDIDDDRFWQVIDRDSGAVVAASDAAEGFGALADREGEAPGLVLLDADDAPFVTAVEQEGGDWIVVAGRSTEEVDSTLATVGVLLAVSVPLVAGVVALTTWFAVGRSLAPVERMRQQVEKMSASDLSRRVDEPETRDEIGRLAHTMNGMLGAARRVAGRAAAVRLGRLARAQVAAGVAAAVRGGRPRAPGSHHGRGAERRRARGGGAARASRAGHARALARGRGRARAPRPPTSISTICCWPKRPACARAERSRSMRPASIPSGCAATSDCSAR